jgi:hypothetical protein
MWSENSWTCAILRQLHASESAGSPKHLLTLTGPVAGKPGKLQVELRTLFSNLNMLNYRLGAFFAPALALFKVTSEWLFDLCVYLGAGS